MNTIRFFIINILFLINYTVFAATDCAVQTDIPQAECDALVALYNSTNGASWTDSPGNNWNQDNSPCGWTGVSCYGGNNVIDIQMVSNNLDGPLPDLSALTNLSMLNLDGNLLTDASNLTSATSLVLIYLSGNQLTGSIPDLSALTNLADLHLNYNQFTGSVPDFTLISLQDLLLNNNQLTGSIPAFSNLPSLKRLWLYTNQLTGNIPDLSASTGLTDLLVYENQLSGTIPALPASLTNTDLGYNALTGETSGTATIEDPDWANTQTMPPTGLSATVLSDTSIKVDWTPIAYTADGGYYQVKYSTTPGGLYTNAVTTTADKIANTYTVADLLAGTTYYFVVETYTPIHALNQSALTSIASAEVSATTTGAINCAAQTDIPQAQCDTLVALYTSTNGAGWTDAATNNWIVTNTPCSWTDVICSGGNVTEIARNTQNLDGTIPDLSALTSLQEMYLNNNLLTGSIPDLSALTNLQLLYLNTNQLTGSIPDLSALTNLQNLCLYENQLTGTIPDLSNLVNLVELEVWYNQLTDPLPDFSALVNLQELWLDGNQFSGSFPDLSALINLTNLGLSENQFTGTIPDLSAFPLVVGNTDLSYNLFTGETGGTATTEDSDWADTQTVPPTLGLSATTLSDTSIKIDWTPITYQADGGYYQVKYSITPGGSYTNAVTTTADKIANTYTVAGLLAGTQYYFVIETFTPAHGTQQNDATSIPSVEITATTTGTINCAAQTDIPQIECEALVVLYNSTNGASWDDAATNNWIVTNTPCSWTGITCNATNVTVVMRYMRGLTGSIPPEIGDLTALTNLNLAENYSLAGPIPVEIGNLTALTSLRLGWVPLGGSIPAEIGNLTALTTLDIWSAQLSGPIPAEIGNLTALTYVDLDDNLLSGPIPPEIGNLTSVERLFLWDNQLSGSIPAEIGNLAALQFLSLDGNQLSGLIPTELTNMTASISITLRNNYLSGDSPDASMNPFLSGLGTLLINNNCLTPTDLTIQSTLEVKDPGWSATQTSCNPPPYVMDVSISGMYSIGQTVTAAYTFIDPAPSSTAEGASTYQWYKADDGIGTNTTAIGGATGITYTLNAGDNWVRFCVTPQDSTLLSGAEQCSAWRPTMDCAATGTTGIPQLQCEALMALYDSTNGASWSDAATNNWIVTNTPCSWAGVVCAAGNITEVNRSSMNLVGSLPDLSALTNLTALRLGDNTLTGSIPNLSTLTALIDIHLYNNQLSGIIPSLSGLNSLEELLLNDNQLTGTIPTLNTSTSLRRILLFNNKLSGTIPALTGITGLTNLFIDNNQLSGLIPALPTTLGNTAALGFNALTTETGTTATDADPDWKDTQTMPTTGLSTTVLSDTSIQVNWTPIAYTADGGYYQVKYSTTSSGPYTNAVTTTADKIANTYTVTGLLAGTQYYFVIETFTPAHGTQQNDATSIPSTEIFAITTGSDTTSFITRWETTTASETITIPTNGAYTYNYDIDCDNDGIFEQIAVTGDGSCTYLTAGQHIIKIRNTFPAIYINNGADKDKILDVLQWGNIAWESMNSAFYGASNLQVSATDLPDLSSVTDMSNMFSGASTFNQDISSWVVSNVTDMSTMFDGASTFNQPLNSWDVSNVAKMSGMFWNADAFNQPLNSWDVSNVTDMDYMFEGASTFNQSLNSWNVSNVIYMYNLFSYASSFNQDISAWDVSNVTDMSSMFNNASSFNQPLNSWVVSNVTDMKNMFLNVSSFNQPLNSWDVSNVADMGVMFAGASAFNQDLSSWDVSNVISMSWMFDGITLSTANYDALLIGWDGLTLQLGVTFNGGNSQYTCGSVAETARTNIISTDSWIITDGGCITITTDCTTQSEIPQVECDTLVALYNSTNGAGWTDAATNNWIVTNTPCSTWIGVVCAAGNITEVNRSSMNLVGSLPDLSALTSLTYLDLGYNLLTGSIPSLNTLSALQTLRLENNQLTGAIPSLINLSSLKGLLLTNNQLTGPIPDLSALVNLQALWIEKNQLSGSIPNLSTLTSLISLFMNDNQLSGTIPDVSAITTLNAFHLENNQLTGIIPDISGLNLTTSNTNFAYNLLSGETLGTASAYDTDWEDTQTIPPTGLITTVISDTSIKIDWTPITYQADGGYYEVKYSTTSGSSYISGGITADKTATTHTVTGLSAGTQYYFIIETYTPTNVNNQSDVTSIPSVEVTATTTGTSVCTTQSEIPQAECDTLVVLYTSTNGAGWTDVATNNWTLTTTPCSWTGITCNSIPGNVTQIDRNTQNLAGIIPDLSALTSLTHIKLYSNQLTDSIPDLSVLTALTWLELSFNQLTGNIDPALLPTSLILLRLGHNQLTGIIPDLSAFTDLTRLRLQSNQLTGAIPDLSILTNLFALDLNSNQLIGNIPDLNTLTNLTYIWLNNNQLIGSIPDLSKLTNLYMLGLHNNQLSGTIPNLSSLPLAVGKTDLSRNAFTAETGTSATDEQSNWADTQTIPPILSDPTVLSDTKIKINWTPIIYTDNGGYYQVKYSTNKGGPYTDALSTTDDKLASDYTITGLTPATTYYFVVETFTPKYWVQQNDITSILSEEIIQTTLSSTTCSSAIVVTNSNNSGTGSLRQAIVDLCTAGTITFDSNYIITLISQLVINKDMTINETGKNIRIDGNTSTRVLKINDGTVELNNLTITNGYVLNNRGAGILIENSSVNLTINNSIFDNNFVECNDGEIHGGGAINNVGGNLIVNNNTFSNNQATNVDGRGGAIRCVNDCTTVINNSTFFGNNANKGGALRIAGSSGNNVTVNNSTFYNNFADVRGGAISNMEGTTTINNSTFSHNKAITNGPGGIYNSTGAILNLKNTIIANSDGFDCENLGTIPTNINNLIKDGTCSASITSDPLLNPLANNSGLTQTMALQTGSPAIDAGDNATCLLTDQRGIIRPQGAACDIGAYEVALLCVVQTDIPQAECDALVALYTSTNGVGWTDAATNNWTLTTTPCSWTGITCSGGFVTEIDRNTQNLTEIIPDLSNLTSLTDLYLNDNQLTDNIPDLSNLTSLTDLYLNNNQLTGNIPDLSNLTSLTDLYLNDNQLTGNIPDLSNLTSLTDLYLNNNQLIGIIPSLPTSLTSTDLSYNAFTSEIDGTATIEDPDWLTTQTIPPTIDLGTIPSSDTSIQVNWTPIAYQTDGGYYEVKYSTTSGSGYVSGCITANKTANTCTVTGLLAGTTYYFVIETYTPANVNNPNDLTSIASPEITATTLLIAPNNLTATVNSSTQITLNWTDNSTDETGFQIERDTNLINTTVADVITYSDTGLTCNTTYNYAVIATNTFGDSVPITATATTQACPPMVLTNLTATVNSSTQITLNWIDNSTDETGFKIERDTNLINTTAADVITYSDTGLTCNTTYNYAVIATNTFGDAIPVTATATTQACPPIVLSNLTATVDSSTQITLNWTDNSTDETGFQIERDGVLINTTAADVISYIDSGLTCNTTYNYAVIATNTFGDSIPVIATATTQACPSNPTTDEPITTKFYKLTINKIGNGRIIGEGIDCNNDCSQLFENQTITNLTIIPNNGWLFEGWSGDCDASGQVLMNTNKNCLATFIEEHNLNIINDGNGIVIINEISCDTDCNQKYPHGTNINLNAIPNNDFIFSNWSGDCVSNDSNQQFTLDFDKNCTVHFANPNIKQDSEIITSDLEDDTSVEPQNNILNFTSEIISNIDEDGIYNYFISVNSENPDDNLTLTVLNKPEWLDFISNDDGIVVLTGISTKTEVESYEIILLIDDGITTIEQSFEIIVLPVENVKSESEPNNLINNTTFAPLSSGCHVNLGIISVSCNAGGMTYQETIIVENDVSVSQGTFERNVENNGLMSNIIIGSNATLTGGKLSGIITNIGTITDVTFMGIELDGGILQGNIVNTSQVGGIIKNVELATGTILSGGLIEGEISSNPSNPAVITNATILPETILSNVRLSPTVKLSNNILLDTSVILPVEPYTTKDFGLEEQVISQLDSTTLATIEPMALSTFTANDIAIIPAVALSSLKPSQIVAINKEAISGLTSAQFQQIPIETLSSLTADNMGGLTTKVIKNINSAQLKALDKNEFKALPNQEVSKLLTNFSSEIINPSQAVELLPKNWEIDLGTGALTVPTGTKLTLASIENGVFISPLTNLNAGFGLSGGGTSLIVGSRRSLAAEDLSQFVLSQNEAGILLVEGTGELAGIVYSFIPDADNAIQVDTNRIPIGLSVNAGGFYTITTPEGLQYGVIPASKDPVAMKKSLGASDLSIGKRGDVVVEFAVQTRRGGSRQVVIMDPFVEPQIDRSCIYVINGVVSCADEQGARFKVVYPDGTAQAFTPTLLAPDIFIGLGMQIQGVESIIFNMDGTFMVTFKGQKYRIVPSFDVALITGNMNPNITINNTGTLNYIVPLANNNAGEVLVFSAFIEPVF